MWQDVVVLALTAAGIGAFVVLVLKTESKTRADLQAEALRWSGWHV